LKERVSCTVCYSNDVNCVLYPCGHKVLCSSCAKLMKSRAPDSNIECPICRKAVLAVLTSYCPSRLKVDTWECGNCKVFNTYMCKTCDSVVEVVAPTAAQDYSKLLETKLHRAKEVLKDMSPTLQALATEGGLVRHPTDVRELQAAIRSLQDSRVCQFCFTNEINVAFFPCGHSLMCDQCSQSHNSTRHTAENCMVCNVRIKSYVVTYSV